MTVLRDILVPVALLRNAAAFGQQQHGDCLRGDLIISNGRATGLRPAMPTDQPRILIPALTEAHCHLDKSHTISRMDQIGGDLTAAIHAQAADKINWSDKDLRRRMKRGVHELSDAGCANLRSHIDWGNDAAPPLAWHVLQEVTEDLPTIVVQQAALTSIPQLVDRQFCFDVAKYISERPGGVLGSFILAHEPADIRHGLSHAFSAAEHYGLALDFHVDEGLGGFNGLEAICDTALETGFQGPVLCGHAVSLIERSKDDLARITDKLLRAKITVCALPTTNLYLQGRRAGTPERRGLTRLRELQAAGVPVVVGSDNVADAFCPMGQHDPRAALHVAALAAHLDPPMGDWLPAITTNAARALGLDASFIDTTPLENLRLCAAESTADLVAGRHPLCPIDLTEEALAP